MLVALALLVVPSCSSNDNDGVTASASPSAAPAKNINVSLKEFSVTPDAPVGAAGDIKFNVTNDGTEVHEFVVISTDLDPGKLPTKADGSVDEDKVDGVDEVEDLAVGKSEDLTVDLDPGPYALVCNRVETENGETQAHYKLGMRTAFTVR